MKPSVAVETHRHAIREIVQQHNASNPRVFGSAATGRDEDGSDLDLLVDPAPGMTLFDIGGMISALEALLGVSVDVLTPGALTPALSVSVMGSLRPL